MRNILRKTRDAMVEVSAGAIALPIRLMPRHLRIGLSDKARMTGQLDYDPAPLRLFVESRSELMRLKSCKKEPGTIVWLEENMGPDDVLYDIGANVGAYTLIAATKAAAGRGKVVAFEPSFRNFSRLNENVQLNRLTGQVVTVPIALSNQDGIAVFHLSSDEIGAASHSMEGATLREAAGPSVAISRILTMRLDDMVRRYDLPLPTMIKLDVDGPELEVLEGAGDMLELPTLRTILVEVERNEESRARLQALLEARNWKLHARSKHYGDAPDEDWIWTRASG